MQFTYENYILIIDTVDDATKTLSICVKTGENCWRRGYVPGNLDRVESDLTVQLPETDTKDVIAYLETLWTEQVVANYNTNVAPQAPQYTLDDFKSEAEDYIATLIEQTAKARGYDSSLSCTSYANSAIPTWKAEANAFIGWRDSVWTTCLQKFSQIAAGQIPVPTLAEIQQALPVINWPS